MSRHHLSIYRPEFAEQARMACDEGATLKDLAGLFRVGVACIKEWRLNFPEFAYAVREGRAVADKQVVFAAFKRAIGYSCPADKIMTVKGEVIKVSYVEHYPPDTGMLIFWLKNRLGWRDTREVSIFDNDQTLTTLKKALERAESDGELPGSDHNPLDEKCSCSWCQYCEAELARK